MWSGSNLLSGSYLRILLSAIKYLGLDLFVYSVSFTVAPGHRAMHNSVSCAQLSVGADKQHTVQEHLINLADVRWLR